MIFKDKTVIITGGSEGVGAATARKFAEAGANLVLVARNKKKLEALAQELRELTRVEIFAMDVADAEACASLFKKAQYEFGRVDVLINNAGYHERGAVLSVDASDLARMIDVNLRAPVMLTRIALPYLKETGGGAIVNVGSLAGMAPIPNSAVYSASKNGLRAFTLALAEEMRGSGIKLAVVAPGPIDTGFIMSDIDKVSDITFSQPISTADDVAQTILDLCGNNRNEQSIPAFSGFLVTLASLMPWLGRSARPLLESRGARVKKRLKVEARLRNEKEKGGPPGG
jgi:short-subunit dehydrogenase